MKVSLALTALVSLVSARLQCSRRPSSTPSYGYGYGYGSPTTTLPEGSKPTSPAGSTSGNKLATGWYPGWVASSFPPSQIPWEMYSALTYAFAITTPDEAFIQIPDDPSVLEEFVSQAHAHNVSALVSVGGWTGSLYFSSSVATSENRTAFANALISFATNNSLDGLDFDWEYPDSDGIGCNVFNSNDAANFLALLKEVRQKAPQGFLLTAAVSMQPFNGQDGNPMTDVSGFAQVLDRIAIMAYDVYGTWSTVGAGPNAPLQDSCAPSKNQLGSCESAVNTWTAAGFPAKQIALGVPSYGHSYTVSSSTINGDAQKLAQFPNFDKTKVPLGTGETSYTTTPDVCGNEQGPGGIFNYNDMVQRGFIDSQGNGNDGLLFQFDNCSQTAYIYNSTSSVLINYDNTDTYKAKGSFIVAKGLAGFAMWSIDTDTPDGTLADAIRSTM